MITVCPGCGHHINDHSAVLISGGLVYHQRCAPAGSRLAPHGPPSPTPWLLWQRNEYTRGAGWILFWILSGLFCWPLAVIVALIIIAARIFAHESRKRH